MKLLVPLLCSIALFAAGQTRATVIDFESLEHAGTGQVSHGMFYSENGFDFASSSTAYNFATWGTLSANYQGSTALWNGDGTGVNGVTTLSRSGGGTFDLVSIDVAELFAPFTGTASVNFIAALSGGGTVLQSFTTDGAAGFETVTFSGFEDVVSVSWLQVTPFVQFDNVTIADAVTAPSMPAILAIGALAIGRFNRRARRSASQT